MLSAALQGANSYLKALEDIRKYGLLPFVWISAALSFVIGAAVMSLIYFYYDDIGGWISNIWVWEWGKTVFTRIAEGFTVLASIFLFFFTFKYLVFILMAPLLSWVSQRMEKKMMGTVSDSKLNLVQEFIRGIRLALRNIVREILLSLAVLILGIILPFMAWSVPIVVFLIQAYYAGFGNMDYTLERYHDTQGSIRYVANRKWFAVGNGAVFLGLLAIPIIGMLIAPFLGAVSAAHVVIREKQDPRF